MYSHSLLHHQCVEAAISRSRASENVAAKARMNVIGAVSHVKMPPRNIPLKEMKALRDLASNKGICILPADKGRGTVVMDRADYDEKVLKMLSEKSTHQPMKKDPTASLERKRMPK